MSRRALTTAILKLLGFLGPGKRAPVRDFAPRRIAVMRFGGFGDVVAVTSLVRAIRVRWPEARIDFITDAASTTVLANNPDISDIVIGRKPALSLNPLRFSGPIRAMREWSRRPYDLAFFTHHDFANEFYPLFFRARYKVGFDIDDRGFDFAYSHSICVYTMGHEKGREHIRTHFTEYYQRLLHAFTGDAQKIEPPVIRIADDERAAARGFLDERGLARNLVVLAPGGADPIKIWPIERYADVARRLLADHDASVIVMLGPAEAHYAKHFDGMGKRFLFDAGGNSFRENIAITEQAAAMVSNDTGLMHVAAVLGVPAAAIFGPTPAAVFGYAHSGHRIVTADMDCVPCNDDACRLLPEGRKHELAPCLDAVTADRVVREVAAILPRAGAA